VYGDVLENTRGVHALSSDESRAVLGKDPNLAYVAAQAEGWPALVGLAANAKLVRRPGEHLPSNLLHSYFAEELFKSASGSLQRRLIQAAVAPDLQPETLNQLFGSESASFLAAANELGFVNLTEDDPELHPLLRDFLLAKLADVAEADAIVTKAIDDCRTRNRWERAFELILRFERVDLVEPVLESAYSPLIRSGQLATLEGFAAKIRAAASFPPATADLAQADVALADGAFELASRVAQRAASRLPHDHHLKMRAHMITAASAYAQARLADAEKAYRAAFEAAQSPQDEVEALRGWALSSFQGEKPVPRWVVNRIEAHRNESPLDLVRHTTLELTRLHFTTGYRDVAALLEETRAVLNRVEDPRTRSSFAHVAAYVAALTARYAEATQWQRLCDADIAAFDLDFAQPHSYWNNGFLALGLRRFGAAERMLQKLEDSIADRPLDYHVLNGRILRGRLALQTGQVDQALRILPLVKHEVVIPSIHGEYIATRGLALASKGLADAALEAAEVATGLTSVVEVRVLAQAIQAITSTPAKRARAARDLWQLADALDVWDPVLASVRTSAPLAAALAENESLREPLAALYRQSNDLGLARRAGLRARAAGAPAQLLSPRELEVLGLLARGCRNRDIADALVVSPSTVKVHVRHIFEKLGVRTRSQAVARLQALDQADSASAEGDSLSASSR
jgi:ATP/maltotriose-dependent transcriptional regulator MalT